MDRKRYSGSKNLSSQWSKTGNRKQPLSDPGKTRLGELETEVSGFRGESRDSVVEPRNLEPGKTLDWFGLGATSGSGFRRTRILFWNLGTWNLEKHWIGLGLARQADLGSEELGFCFGT